MTERLRAFRSLGGNCEFGFAQRYGGAEPSGLLRFSYTPVADLIHALDTDFAEYGAPGDLRIEATGGDTYYCRSSRYNIWANTAQPVGSIEPDALLAREYGRIDHLKRRMLTELAEGSKILVRKADQGETEADFARLAAALARHGPSTLLRVSEAGPDWRPEPVLRLGERLYAGRVRRFAPTETAWNLDLEPWLALCESAYAARHGLAEAASGAAPVPHAIPLSTRLRRHRGRHREHRLSAYTREIDPTRLDAERVYVFSAWVWIPARFSGSRVFAVAGQDRLGWQDADLAVRERWQRIWAARRFRTDAARVGLALVGDRRDRFWSWGARIHEGVAPAPAAPPAIDPTSVLSRWFSRG